MQISSSTTIGSVLKFRPESLDAITAISKKFEKLRNPLLRRLMANRTTIAQAARMGHCSVEDFYEALAPLGFSAYDNKGEKIDSTNRTKSNFLKHIRPEQIKQLDVRPLLQQGHDPLKEIMQTLNVCRAHKQALLLITDFEPTPLVQLLSKKGYDSHIEWINTDLVHSYFYKESGLKKEDEPGFASTDDGDWEDVLNRFENRIRTIDVHNLEKPKPMITILKELETLPEDHLLFVYHKRFPAFLVDELKMKNFSFMVKENAPGDAHVLIYKS